jgi:hypothetical protein
MNEYQNNMDISCESDLNYNTTRERDSQANYTSVESSEGCSIVASSDLSKSSTILPDKILGSFIYRGQVRNTYFWNSFAMNKYQNNMDISCESNFNNTTRDRSHKYDLKIIMKNLKRATFYSQTTRIDMITLYTTTFYLQYMATFG